MQAAPQRIQLSGNAAREGAEKATTDAKQEIFRGETFLSAYSVPATRRDFVKPLKRYYGVGITSVLHVQKSSGTFVKHCHQTMSLDLRDI